MGICLGITVSLIGIVRAGPEVALVVALTMVCTVLLRQPGGMSLPFLLNRMKIDTATVSALWSHPLPMSAAY
nr:magnesium transporter [Desulfonatronum thiosulfatophilum]